MIANLTLKSVAHIYVAVCQVLGLAYAVDIWIIALVANGATGIVGCGSKAIYRGHNDGGANTGQVYGVVCVTYIALIQIIEKSYAIWVVLNNTSIVCGS